MVTGKQMNFEVPQEEDVGLVYVKSLIWLADHLKSHVPDIRRTSRQERRQMAAGLHASENKSDALLKTLLVLFRRSGIEESGWHNLPNLSELPMVAIVPNEGYWVVYGQGASGEWLIEGVGGRKRVEGWPDGCKFAAAHAKPAQVKSRTARTLFRQAMKAESGWIFYSVLASLVGSVLALATSLYSMQVYDRVVGTGAVATLIVLTSGVLIAILLEFLIRLARATIIDKATTEIDHICAHGVFERLINVRYDQQPGSVGTLASQVRAYESIRSFSINLLIFLTSDGPFAVFFLFVIFLLAGSLVASVPLIFMLISAVVGLVFRSRIEAATKAQIGSGNRRNGLLIEAIDGAESLKASGASWFLIGRWNELSRQNISEAMQIKHLNEISSYFAASLQQVSYIGLVAAGAWIAATTTDLTTGGIIACSILSGRALSPVGQIPGLLVQWANAKISLEQLEALFKLESDNHNIEMPLTPEALSGRYELEDVKFVYPGQYTALNLKKLSIQSGEKVAIVGPIGAGKSTLLRLLAGLIKPQRGKVLIDGLDIQQISAERRAELIGYLSQKTALIGGTLRQNLMIGLAPVTEGDLLAACQATGLSNLIAARTEGLDIVIPEGGGGLSGGQQQLVAVTRLILSRPTVWLLDEPTAAMDEVTESRCISSLYESIKEDQTLVLVTHKIQMLRLVSRIVVLGPEGVVMDGPRDAVLSKLAAGASNAKPSSQPANADINSFHRDEA